MHTFLDDRREPVSAIASHTMRLGSFFASAEPATGIETAGALVEDVPPAPAAVAKAIAISIPPAKLLKNIGLLLEAANSMDIALPAKTVVFKETLLALSMLHAGLPPLNREECRIARPHF